MATPPNVKAEVDAALQNKNYCDRVNLLQNQNQFIYTRLNLLLSLQNLQSENGGTLPKATVFVHLTPNRVLNIRRIGFIDVWTLVVPFEVYEHLGIKDGMVWVPVDSVTWWGCADETLVPEGHAGLGIKAKSEVSSEIGLKARSLVTFPVPPPRQK